MRTKNSEFFKGVRDTLPLSIGAIPAGIIFGALSCRAGLSAIGTMGMSLMVFNGPSQFIAISLVAAGTAWPMIVLTTFVVNLRLLLYAATLLPYVQKLPRYWQALLCTGMTDPVFLVSVGHWREKDDSPRKHWYQLGSMVFMYTIWNVCTAIGIVTGQTIKGIDGWGADFIMVAAFISMILSYLRDLPNLCAALAAGIVSLILYGLPHQLGLIIAAIVGVSCGVSAQRLHTSNKNYLFKESGK